MVKSQESFQATNWRDYVAAESKRLGIKSTPPVASPDVPAVHYDPKFTKAMKSRVGHVETLARNAGEQYKPDEMNGLEKRYAAYLETRRVCGEILGWRFEPLKLKLAKATFYNVDFSLTMPDRTIELHETKGFWRDDARVKIKIAAAMFTEYRFVAVQWKGKAYGWKFEEFGR